jgi:hypothetical protein
VDNRNTVNLSACIRTGFAGGQVESEADNKVEG